MNRSGTGFDRRAALLAGFALAAARSARAAEDGAAYPSRPIRLLLPTPAGGALDGTARAIAERIGEAWKQPLIVESRAGGNGAIAYAAVAKASPDGYTIGLTISSLVQNILLQKQTTYSLAELAPVSLVAMLPNAFAVGRDVPARTLAEFVEWARLLPNGADYGTSGAGSSGNIMGGTLASVANIRLLHVPFKGELPAIQAVIGGQVQSVMAAPGSVAAQARSGSMRVLAIAMPTRLPDFPDVPTFAELGYPSVNLSGWSLAIAPAATPRAIVDKLATEIARVVRLPDVKAKIFNFGFVPEGGTPEAARRFVDDEMRRWGSAIKTANVSIE